MTLTYNDLSQVDIKEIVTCSNESFRGYFVPIPTEVAYWVARYALQQVDYSHSWGVFDASQLVGFVIHAIGESQGMRTAYNAGTGVLPAYRGRAAVDKMYHHGLDALKASGVKRCTLEVITENERAVRVYKRIGFDTLRRLHCYKGEIDFINIDARKARCTLEEALQRGEDDHYSWDFQSERILHAYNKYRAYNVYIDAGQLAGSFILHNEQPTIARIEATHGNWEAVFSGIRQLTKAVKINNVDEGRKELLACISNLNIAHVIDQYEMQMLL